MTLIIYLTGVAASLVACATQLSLRTQPIRAPQVYATAFLAGLSWAGIALLYWAKAERRKLAAEG